MSFSSENILIYIGEEGWGHQNVILKFSFKTSPRNIWSNLPSLLMSTFFEVLFWKHLAIWLLVCFAVIVASCFSSWFFFFFFFPHQGCVFVRVKLFCKPSLCSSRLSSFELAELTLMHCICSAHTLQKPPPYLLVC